VTGRIPFPPFFFEISEKAPRMNAFQRAADSYSPSRCNVKIATWVASFQMCAIPPGVDLTRLAKQVIFSSFLASFYCFNEAGLNSEFIGCLRKDGDLHVTKDAMVPRFSK
jgi:hypothetical protein